MNLSSAGLGDWQNEYRNEKFNYIIAILVVELVRTGSEVMWELDQITAVLELG